MYKEILSHARCSVVKLFMEWLFHFLKFTDVSVIFTILSVYGGMADVIENFSKKMPKDFEKSVLKLSGMTLNPVKNTILEVGDVSCLDEIIGYKI